MSVTADIIEPWLLVVGDFKLRTVKHVENRASEKIIVGWLEDAEHFMVHQRRHFVGLNGFSNSAIAGQGGILAEFEWYVGRRRTLKYTVISSRAAGIYCTGNKITMEDEVTGSGWEEQIWEMQSKFKQVPGSYFKETVTE